MFDNWLNGLDRQSKAFIRIGVSALCWSIWRVRNNIIFNRKNSFHFLQVIHMVAHWVQLWALRSPKRQRDAMASGCIRLQTSNAPILQATSESVSDTVSDTDTPPIRPRYVSKEYPLINGLKQFRYLKDTFSVCFGYGPAHLRDHSAQLRGRQQP